MDISSYLLGKKAGSGGGGTDLSEYFVETWTISGANLIQPILKFPDLYIGSNVSNLQNAFKDYTLDVVPKIISNNNNNILYVSNMFLNASKVKKIDLSEFYIPYVQNITAMFRGCYSLEKLDIRTFIFSNFSIYGNLFTNVPTDCEIIVKDDEQKQWVNTNFSSYTNVKTVAEYEAE